MKKDFTFEGFEPANTTPVPDVLFDVLLPQLSEAELKVLLYIIRRTAGFKKNDDAISLGQFQHGITKRNGKVLDNGCGVKNRTTISSALASLEAMGCIQCDKGDDPQGDKATTVFRVHFKAGGVVRKSYHGSTQIVPPVVSETYHGSTQNAPGVVRETYPQETVIQDTDSQETVIQEGTYGANAPTHADISHQREIVEKRITHPRIEAVSTEMLSDSQRLSEEEPPLIPPRLTLPSKPVANKQAVAAGQAPSPLDAPSRQSTVSEQTPGTPARPLAAGTADVTSRHGDAGSDQASRSLLLDSEPAQADFPPAGSAASGATTAQASGFVPPKRPRGKQPVVALTLMGSEVMQWIGEIRGAKPRMTSGNVRACNALAECDGMSKEALAAYFASIEAQNREVDLLTV